MQKKQAFEMTPPKERHQADREWVGGATPFFIISCKSLQKKQAFEMTPPKERHQADREWVGGATPWRMKKIVRFFLLFIIFTALWGFYNGCKKDEPFDIRGVWEFVENRDDQDSSNHFTVILAGSINEGSVERHPVKDNYWRGTYQVDKNQVVIHISYCRGTACRNIYYRGSVMTEKLVVGSLEGYASLGGDVYYTWTGTWQISRE